MSDLVDRRPRGFSLIEVTIAMTLLAVGAVGVLGIATQSAQMNGEGRRVTRATALAQDLVANIDLWSYDDPRLFNKNPGNDADVGDTAQAFEGDPFGDSSTTPDHAEADLTAGGAQWLGVPAAEITAAGYERYWNVAEVDDWNGNHVPDAKRIAVIVRWPHNAGFRRVVLFTTKVNPADAQ